MAYLLISVLLIQSAPIPGIWQKIDRLQAQSEIELTMKSGQTMRGLFQRSTADAVLIRNDAGADVTLAKADIQRVVKPKGRDRIRNGILIGAAIGFGAGFLALMAYDRGLTESGYRFDAEAAGIYTSAGLLGAGIGAAAGAGIDYAIKGAEVLYEARP